MTPTQRTIRELKNLGRECAIAEKWIPGANIRRDLFGIIDVVALDPERGVVGIQSTGSAFSQHYQKLTVECYQNTFNWLSTPGASLELWGWRKVKKVRGGKQMIWQPRIQEITMADLGIEAEDPRKRVSFTPGEIDSLTQGLDLLMSNEALFDSVAGKVQLIMNLSGAIERLKAA